MSKFSAGEVAIFWLTGDIDHQKEIEVMTVDTISSAGEPADYDIKIPGNQHHNHPKGWWCCDEELLRKNKPPQEQLKTWEELKKDLGMGTEKVPVDAR